MKTKIYKILAFLTTIFIFNIANANVDVTNSFWYTYDCNSDWWILHTTFNLGWHHLYKRDYKIDLPWIIEIADENHITTSKNLNVSISWCNYKINSCNIFTYWEWKDTNNDKDFFNLSIETDWNISKNNNIIEISWKNWNNSSLKTTIIYSWKEYNFNWNSVFIELNEENIKLNNKIIEFFTNKIYNWTKEFYYEISNDNKNIFLKRKIFKRINTWTTRSSNNVYDTFEAYKWNNVGFALSSNKDTQGPDYTTWLNYWDYTQHYYTTTKVKLYSVDLWCNKEEYSDWETHVNIDSFDWTLSWIIEPEFSWPVKINWECQKFNWTCSNSSNWSIKIFSTDKIALDGLRYSQVWEIWWNKIWVDSIEFTLKKRDQLTYLKKKINISKKTGIWDFWVLNFNDFEILNWSDNLLTKTWNYWVELVLYSWNQIVWTYSFPLIIVPNYEYTKTRTLEKVWNLWFANNSDNYNFCQNITDSFWNKYNNLWDIDVEILWNWFYLNQVNNIWEWLNIYNKTFNDSKLCFSVKSYSPWENNITFYSNFKKYDLDWNFVWNKQINITENISFLKPFITNDFSIINANKKLEIWPSLNMNLEIMPKSILKDYSINDFSNNINLWDTINHEFTKQPVSIQNNNLKYSFTIDAKTNNWIDVAPSIVLDKNPIISYIIDWKSIKYYVNKSTNPNNNDKLSLSWVKWISGIKVVWTSQTTWKSDATNNIVNFSDLSKSTLRASVKKNTSIITKWLSAWKLSNWVIYYNWDKKTSAIQSEIWFSNIETLVIKNWNLIIDQNNLWWNKDKFWIIVTRDDNSKTNLWNIYITPWVTYIKSSIYADWWIISSNNSWIPYTSDTDERTNILNNQLIIKWSILTRNTIWWAVNAWWKYILPGWETTTDFNSAMIYDLNYLRRSNNWWDSNKLLNNNNSNNVVIIYNSLIQTNPPKWFWN